MIKDLVVGILHELVVLGVYKLDSFWYSFLHIYFRMRLV